MIFTQILGKVRDSVDRERQFLGLFIVMMVMILLAGCAGTPSFHRNTTAHQIPRQARVLLMPPDIQLFELTAGGLEEPRVDWTEVANSHVLSVLDDFARQRQDTLVPYPGLPENSETAFLHQQVFKLHEVVGWSVLVHKYSPGSQLPTKQEKFDWSLGEGARALGQPDDADYALFVYLRDSYSSGGRVAVMVAAALMGAVVQGGVQAGFASLVDLNTGNIIWFNRLVREYGDLRGRQSAAEAVSQLLRGYPL